jgi:hypothetical protein
MLTVVKHQHHRLSRAPVFDNYSDLDEKYSLTSTIPSGWSSRGLGDKETTTYREAPVLDNHSESDDDPESFSGNHLGLTISSTPQGCFVYWKGLEHSELLEYDSRLMVFMQELPFQEGKPLSPSQNPRSVTLRYTHHLQEASPLLRRIQHLGDH